MLKIKNTEVVRTSGRVASRPQNGIRNMRRGEEESMVL